MTINILIGSPIHQKPNILALFLKSLQRLNTEKLQLSYMFIDDNVDEVSSNLLKEFAQQKYRRDDRNIDTSRFIRNE